MGFSSGRSNALLKAQLLLRRRDDLKDGSESTRESMEINEADFRWQRQVLSSEHALCDPDSSSANAASSERSPDISISITTETGQTTTGVEAGERVPGHTSPDDRAGESRLPSPSCGRNQQAGKCAAMGPESGHREEAGKAGHVEQEREKRRASGGGGECGGGGERGIVVPPDVVQRSHALVYPDITNFLSVESRTRTHHGGGSRYSESNFRWGFSALCN